MNYLQKNLHYIDPKTICFDPNNPRGETEKQIVSDENFSRLIDSIKEYGVLTPVVIRNNGQDGKKYILVDGERRLRASLDINMKEIPTLIAPDEINGRILAYQIHKLRKDWSKATETKSIKIIIEEIKVGHPDISEVDLMKKIRDITKSSDQELRDIMDLIKYDDDIIQQVIENKNNNLLMSHLVQIEQSFVSKIVKKYPEIIQKYSEHEIRHILANKAAKGILGNTRYLMDTFKDVFDEKEHHDEIRDLLLGFLHRKSENITTTYDAFVGLLPKEKEKKSKAKPKKARKAKKRKTEKEQTSVPEEVDSRKELGQYESELIQNRIFDIIFHYMKGAVNEFERRTNSIFKNEPELQNFIFAVLRCLFASVEYEDPTEKICGTFTRKDFVIKDHKIIIEVKYVHKSGDQQKIANELSIDYPRYKNCKYGGTIINYIYDPKGCITNHSQYSKELKKLLPEAHHYIQ